MGHNANPKHSDLLPALEGEDPAKAGGSGLHPLPEGSIPGRASGPLPLPIPGAIGLASIIALGSKSLNRLIEMKIIYRLSSHPHLERRGFQL